MARTGLLKVACTVAVLAAAPAFAQSNTETGSTGSGGTAVNPTAHETMPMTGHDSMSSGGKAMGSHAGMGGHRRAMMGHSDAMHGKMSQDAAVDQLNDQSYQAAHSGQAYSGGSTGGGMMTPSGSAGKNDMSGGAMSNNGSSNNGSK